MTEYEKLMKSIDFKKYNKWIKEKRVITEETNYWMLSGIRLLAKHEKEKYPNEFLLPISKEEHDYYENLKK